MMRIISGTARGRKLAEFSGSGTRPTSDRAREALFSLLISRLQTLSGLKVLDLYAGSGALSLEALSRQAKSALMIDSSRSAIKLIHENIERCGFADRSRVLQQEVSAALPGLKAQAPFDLIFLDPPYNQSLVQPVINEIYRLNLLDENGIICAETERGTTLQSAGTLSCTTSRHYGRTTLHLMQHTASNKD